MVTGSFTRRSSSFQPGGDLTWSGFSNFGTLIRLFESISLGEKERNLSTRRKLVESVVSASDVASRVSPEIIPGEALSEYRDIVMLDLLRKKRPLGIRSLFRKAK